MVKKAQLKLMENVFVVFLLIFIGAIVLIVYSVNSINEQKQNLELKQSIESLNLLKLFSTFPEVECSIGDEIKENCIDLYKAKIFSEKTKTLEGKKLYFPILGYSNITLNYLDENMKEKKIILYDFEKKNYNTKISYQMPLLAYNNTYTFGYIEVYLYR